MQLFVILAALVAVNVGIVYVGSEAYEEEQNQQNQGVVEVEEVVEATTEEAPVDEQAPAAQ